MARHSHHGIPCKLPAGSPACANVEAVLARIAERRPSDYQRAVRSVSEIRRLTRAEQADGTLAQYGEDGAGQFGGMPSTWEESLEFDRLGICRRNALKLSADATIATIAHEFGHAAARPEDEERGHPFGEWNSELTADWFAYRWGFGREVARERRGRDFHHHGPKPGDTFEAMGRTYRVTRAFRVRLIH